MTVRGVNPVALAKDTFREFRDDDVSGLAAELTYRTFLALFPFIIFLTALGGALAKALSVENPAERFLELFGGQLPGDARSVITTQVQEVVNGTNVGLISAGILGALWAAGGGAAALMKALNRAYDIPDTRPFWKQKLLAVGLVLAATVAIFATIALFVATRAYGTEIAEAVGLGPTFEAVLRWGTYPLVAVLALAAVAFVYWAAPDAGLPFRWVSPGAIFFVVAWLIATVAFGLYVANFSSYNATYGALGGVVVLLLWFYLSNIVLLTGAELNAVIDEHTNGPVLAERREKAAEALAAKREKQPRNPDVMGAEPGRTAAGLVASTDGRDATAAAVSDAAGGETPRRASGAPGTLMALIGGVAVAALAVRRFAR